MFINMSPISTSFCLIHGSQAIRRIAVTSMICVLSLLILRVTMKQLVRVMTELLNVGVSTDIQEKIVIYLQVWIPIIAKN